MPQPEPVNEPFYFGFTPVHLTTEPGKYAGTRYQRVRVRIPAMPGGPVDAWITVHEDGRLTLGSNTHTFHPDTLMQGKEPTLGLSTRPIAPANAKKG
jgi:hypothetical protein